MQKSREIFFIAGVFYLFITLISGRSQKLDFRYSVQSYLDNILRTEELKKTISYRTFISNKFGKFLNFSCSQCVRARNSGASQWVVLFLPLSTVYWTTRDTKLIASSFCQKNGTSNFCGPIPSSITWDNEKCVLGSILGRIIFPH